jgi:hypothetical protein
MGGGSVLEGICIPCRPLGRVTSTHEYLTPFMVKLFMVITIYFEVFIYLDDLRQYIAYDDLNLHLLLL